MLKKTIGFDLDGIFIASPPLVPKSIIEWLYKDHNKNKLAYRMPSYFEQKIRQLSHLPFVRPPISQNCNLIKKLAKEGSYDFYLVSGRFGFLKNLTYAWLSKHKMQNVFSKIYLNADCEQPHYFKEKILRRISLDQYIDDDLDSLEYLAEKLPKIHFYWYTKKNGLKIRNKNVTALFDLAKILK